MPPDAFSMTASLDRTENVFVEWLSWEPLVRNRSVYYTLCTDVWMLQFGVISYMCCCNIMLLNAVNESRMNVLYCGGLNVFTGFSSSDADVQLHI